MSTFSDSIPFFMTTETARDLLRQSRERHAKHQRQVVIRAALAASLLEESLPNRRQVDSDRRLFHTMADKLAFMDRRHGDRRAERFAP